MSAGVRVTMKCAAQTSDVLLGILLRMENIDWSPDTILTCDWLPDRILTSDWLPDTKLSTGLYLVIRLNTDL